MRCIQPGYFLAEFAAIAPKQAGSLSACNQDSLGLIRSISLNVCCSPFIALLHSYCFDSSNKGFLILSGDLNVDLLFYSSPIMGLFFLEAMITV